MADPTTTMCLLFAFMGLVVLVLAIVTVNRKLRGLPPAPPIKPTVYEKLPTLPANWRRPPRTCPKCGYDLRATPSRCPECGTVFASPTTTEVDREDKPPL